jgi:uncharacterized membrane protein/2-hydroxychromene-2-carboxylate isomerase
MVVLRLLALVGLGVSSALVADSVFEIGTFCRPDDPCGEVAASSYGQVFGVPLSAVGLVGFSLILLTSLVPTRWAAAAVRLLAVVAGLAGAGLLIIQLAVLRQVCPYCVAADLSGIGMAVIALARRPPAARPGGGWGEVLGWLWGGRVAGLGPLFWEAAHLPTTAPPQVQAHWVPGKITVVEVTDFDCPHCQRADPVVRAWLARHDVKFVRLVAPLPGHMEAWPAATAYVAAVRQGKGEPMAEALYAAASRDRASCRRLATQLGLDLAAYDLAVADPAVESEIRATYKWVEAYGLGLPFFWIQDELVVGMPTFDRLDQALARAKPAP